MIKGIGTDIVEIKRIRDTVNRQGKKFLHIVFTSKEIAYCYSKKNIYQHLAVRFAAKEATIKALSSIFKNPSRLSLKSIEIVNNLDGKPNIFFTEDIGLKKFNIHLSLSHEKNYAVAVVIIEK